MVTINGIVRHTIVNGTATTPTSLFS